MTLRNTDVPLANLRRASCHEAHRRPRVFFMGTDEQQDKSGFIQALQRVADVEVFTREDGAWGQNDPAAYEVRRTRNTRRLWELVSELSAGEEGSIKTGSLDLQENNIINVGKG